MIQCLGVFPLAGSSQAAARAVHCSTGLTGLEQVSIPPGRQLGLWGCMHGIRSSGLSCPVPVPGGTSRQHSTTVCKPALCRLRNGVAGVCSALAEMVKGCVFGQALSQ